MICGIYKSVFNARNFEISKNFPLEIYYQSKINETLVDNSTILEKYHAIFKNVSI